MYASVDKALGDIYRPYTFFRLARGRNNEFMKTVIPIRDLIVFLKMELQLPRVKNRVLSGLNQTLPPQKQYVGVSFQ